MADESRIQAFARQAAQLLPRGLIWDSPGPVIGALLEGFGEELANVEEKLEQLVDEAFPNTAVELLADWERVLGLPGSCTELAPTILLRQKAAATRFGTQRGSAIEAWVELANDLGYPITVDDVQEYRAFQVGRSTVGEALTNAATGWPLTWTVHAPVASPTFFAASQGAAGEPLQSSDNDLLECTFEDRKPAHTIVTFEYDGAWSGWAPWDEIVPGSVDIILEAPTVNVVVG